ncbi:MAG: alpha/beta fold hydrolase, partial [Candidatus Zixiibacteriota bacterium]
GIVMPIPAPGETFRQFRIIDRVGEGGMGIVLHAHDTRLARDVALKFLTRLGPMSAEHAERVRREARSLAALNHQNIVTLYDIDELDGIPFLVLEWVPGVDLDASGRPGPLGSEEFLQLALPVAEALAAAHRIGMIHRDIKPNNVRVTPDSRVKLVDFGLAKIVSNGEIVTTSNALMGTVAYMSPEQAKGEEILPASDVFSFGVLSYELLTGRRPFPGQRAPEILYGIVHEPHPPLASLRPDLPAGLIAALERCLTKRPQERWRDGAELAEALRRSSRHSAILSSDGTAATTIRFGDTGLIREQTIRYCTTTDGLRIAYSIVGAGRPIVRVLGWFTHLEMEWDWPDLRYFWEGLAARQRVIRYDGRGIGLSDRYQGGFTEEARLRDLESVIDALDVDKVTLLGISEGGWTACQYAIRYPERVTHLVLHGCYARGALARPSFDPEEDAALITLMRKGWGANVTRYRKMMAGQFFPDNCDPETIEYFSELQRASADPETAVRYHTANHQRGDGSDFIRQVRTPALVIHSREDAVVHFEEGRYLASLIPGAKFLPIPGQSHYFPTRRPETDELIDTILRFLAE